MTLPIWTGAACLSALAVAAWVLTRKRPEWCRVARALSALATIDAARAVLAPYSQAMISPWWSLDVALFAAWPCVMAWALKGRGPGAEAPSPLDSASGVVLSSGGSSSAGPSPGSFAAHRAPRSVLPPRPLEIVCAKSRAVRARWQAFAALGYVILLGAARPWLPAWAHLAGQVAPRVVLAGAWMGAVWRMWKDEGREAETSRPHLPAGFEAATSALRERRSTSLSYGNEQHSHGPARLPALAALLLAGCDVAAAAVAWSPALRGVAPAWPVARGLTLAGYAACVVVMGWALLRRRPR